jgi:hypothetical protein
MNEKGFRYPVRENKKDFMRTNENCTVDLITVMHIHRKHPNSQQGDFMIKSFLTVL